MHNRDDRRIAFILYGTVIAWQLFLSPRLPISLLQYVDRILPIFSIYHSTCDGLKPASNVWCLVHRLVLSPSFGA